MKKLFTKTLTLLLAAAMLAGLCGCNSGSPDETTPDAGAGADADTDTVISVTEENTYSKPLPNLPEVPYWFPNDLLSWDPAQDPDAAYNVSAVPLAQRTPDRKSTRLNSSH